MDSAEIARAYREGFKRGATAVLGAVGDELSEQQRRVLGGWISGALRAWIDGSADDPQPQLPLIDGA